MKFQASRVCSPMAESLCNCRYTFDAFILARHWILAVVRKTGSIGNQSGHLVSGGRQPSPEAVSPSGSMAAIPGHGTATYTSTSIPVHK